MTSKGNIGGNTLNEEAHAVRPTVQETARESDAVNGELVVVCLLGVVLLLAVGVFVVVHQRKKRHLAYYHHQQVPVAAPPPSPSITHHTSQRTAQKHQPSQRGGHALASARAGLQRTR